MTRAITHLGSPAISGFARTNFVEEINQKKYAEAPEWFKNWENQGMIAWVDKNKDGVMQYSAGTVFSGKPVYADDSRIEGGPRPVSNEISDSSNEVHHQWNTGRESL